MQKKMEGNPSHEYYLPSAMRCNLTQLASQSPPWRRIEELQGSNQLPAQNWMLPFLLCSYLMLLTWRIC